MDFKEFVRKPFVVEAVEITDDNIEDLAQYIGTVGHNNGRPFIQVDRRLVPNIDRVYPGYWMTRMGDNTRCYSKKIFNKQFVENDEKIRSWVDYMEARPTPNTI